MKTILTLAFLLFGATAVQAQQKLEFTLPSNADIMLQYTGEVQNGKANGYGEAGTFFKGKADGNYKGYWKDNTFHGKGVKTYGDGGKYDGNWLNGKQQGQGVQIWANGDKYDGNWVNNQRTGKGNYYWADGGRYEGGWQNGQRHGYGKMTWGKGQYEGHRYEGDWQNDRRTGKGIYYWADGGQYEGDWQNGQQQGYGKYTYANGERYEGDFANGKRHGKGTYYITGGTIYEGGFVNGSYSGKGTMTWTDGAKYVGDFTNGGRTGQGTYTWADGARYEGSWQNGQRHGYGKHAYANGAIEEGQWENNVFKGSANASGAVNSVTAANSNGMPKQSAEDALDSRNIWIKGMDYAEKGQYDLAIQEYNKAIQLYPTMSLYYIDRGRAHSMKVDEFVSKGNQADAEKSASLALNDFNEAIRLSPKSAEAYIERGRYYYLAQEDQKALDDLSKAIELDKNINKSIRAYYTRSKIYEYLGETGKAEADMKKYLELGGKAETKAASAVQSKTADDYFAQGNADLKTRNYDNAILSFTSAISLNPDHTSSFQNRAVCYLQQALAFGTGISETEKKELLDKAWVDINRALYLNPQLAAGYYLRSIYYQANANWQYAVNEISKGIELDPGNAAFYDHRANMYRILNQDDKKMADIRRANELRGK